MAQEKLGKRKTNQRQTILEVILEAKKPLTVNEIHKLGMAQSSSLGIATVYRTIKLLLAGNKIKPVNLPDSEPRYEAADLHHHHHFQCRACEGVFDLDLCPMAVPTGTTLPSGFVIEDHHVTLYGLCPGCNEP